MHALLHFPTPSVCLFLNSFLHLSSILLPSVFLFMPRTLSIKSKKSIITRNCIDLFARDQVHDFPHTKSISDLHPPNIFNYFVIVCLVTR